MFELDEIEELFKNTELIKSKKMIEALLQNTRMLQSPDITPEQRELAQANIKAITSGGRPISNAPKKVKAIAPPSSQQVIQPVAPANIQPQTPLNPAITPASPIGNIKLKYSPAYEHYGVTPEHWNQASPEAHQGLFAHHNEVMAGKHPELMHIKNAVEQSKAKMMKSVEQLHNLFSQLKKHL